MSAHRLEPVLYLFFILGQSLLFAFFLLLTLRQEVHTVLNMRGQQPMQHVRGDAAAYTSGQGNLILSQGQFHAVTSPCDCFVFSFVLYTI